jgi:fatty-acyl-CoA synthase
MHLARHAAYWADLRGDRPAAVFHDRTLTWAELNRQADALAATLQSLGVEPGERVGCLLPNGLEWVVAWTATHKAGGVFVPLNPRYGDTELREIAALTACRVIVSVAPQVARIDPAAATGAGSADAVHLFPMQPPHGAVPFDTATQGRARPAPRAGTPDDLALITFTSGSTGRPKGAMFTHRALQTVVFSMAAALRLNSEDRTLLLAPFAFTGGLICVYLPTFVLGSCIHIEETLDAERALATIERERITVMTGVPILWERMAASPRFAAADLTSLRVASTGGAPVPAVLLEAYVHKGIGIVQTYGCTEAGGYITIPATADGRAKPWTCGTPLLSIELQVVDAQGRPCATDETGEILLRGEQMFAGYWRDPESTTAAWRDGWYHTGDLGQRDAQGHLRITDRKKNMIISGGVNVYPAEVERILATLPGVDEVLVFGLPDPAWGERVIALVHGPRIGSCEALMQQARQALGSYKTPKEIVLSATPLPRTASGKVSRQGVAALYGTLADAPRATAERPAVQPLR